MSNKATHGLARGFIATYPRGPMHSYYLYPLHRVTAAGAFAERQSLDPFVWRGVDLVESLDLVQLVKVVRCIAHSKLVGEE